MLRKVSLLVIILASTVWADVDQKCEWGPGPNGKLRWIEVHAAKLEAGGTDHYHFHLEKGMDVRLTIGGNNAGAVATVWHGDRASGTILADAYNVHGKRFDVPATDDYTLDVTGKDGKATVYGLTLSNHLK